MTELQRLYPDDKTCAMHLERARWPDGFCCSHCGAPGAPYRSTTRPSVLRCRACRKDNRLAVGTVMEGSHLPLRLWCWAAHLVWDRPDLSAAELQRQLGLSRYATAWMMGNHLRARVAALGADRVAAADPHACLSLLGRATGD